MIVRLSSLLAARCCRPGMRPGVSSSLSQLQGLCCQSKPHAESQGRKGTSFAPLAALALGGVIAGVSVQQLFMQPASTPRAPLEQQPDTKMNENKSATISQLPQQHAQDSTATSVLTTPDPVLASLQEAKSAPADAGPQGPWVLDEEMELIIHRRIVTKNRLMAYINSMQQRMHQMAAEAQMMGRRGEAWFNERMKELEVAVDLQAQIILFGVDEPNARRKHLEQYGCSKWTDEALSIIKRFSPIIEIGAGHGHWQHALSEKGVDVVSFDDHSSLPMEGLPNVGLVQQGDETELRKHRRRTLLLVYPGPDEMGTKCLKEYKGDYLLYVGESRGGINGNTEFFDMLEQGWEVESCSPLDPFPDGYEKLYVLRRKGRKQRGKGWWR